MQYKYIYATHRRMLGSKDFDDLLEAVGYMNKHCEETFGIVRAEIIDTKANDQVVCAKRIKL